jgi:polar amino acid transport system ATP-binding protein
MFTRVSTTSFPLASPPRTAASQNDYAIAFRNVSKLYGGRKVLDGITLNIRNGETRCVIGASGSGKSTLLRCINALIDFDEGAIVVGGQRVGYTDDGKPALRRWSETEAAAFRSGIGFVSQSINLFQHRTILQNVMEGPVHVLSLARKAARERAEGLLARVGLSDKLESYPGQLSGGQQQRAAIARALAMEPRIMLFDEATSALDPELVDEVLGVMRTLSHSGMTMVVVTHEMRFAEQASDSVTVINAGRVVEEGPVSEVFARPTNPRTGLLLRHQMAEARHSSY